MSTPKDPTEERWYYNPREARTPLPKPSHPQAPAEGVLTAYDPNIVWAKHTVAITYQLWDYTGTFKVSIRGNCRGFSILDNAIEHHADALFREGGENAVLILKRPSPEGNGEDTLECDADENSLQEMCVGLRIVRHEKGMR